ncbi:hypothetical protein HELRODRAFT_81117, partial [Helobdella robusta]|uniref:c-Myc-binding protein n=1 Tax=Helobdella robusta TaxID=6412 RepID=T1G496_HELRO
SKQEEFRKYLEENGVVDTLTKILVCLYEEPDKPKDAIGFIKQHIGITGPDTADIKALQLEISELRNKVEELIEENCSLKSKVTC